MLIELVKGLGERNLPYWVVGHGTNLLVKDKGIRGVVIVLKKAFGEIMGNSRDGVVRVMAGAPMSRLCRFALRDGLAGMNFALGIPGTLGGAIVTNAGTSFGDMAKVLKQATFLFPNGKIKKIVREKLRLSYRRMGGDNNPAGEGDSAPIILEASLVLNPDDPVRLKKQAAEIVKWRKNNQPISLPSAGCFFKNPDPEKPAGKLIDLAGLKGKCCGGAEISSRHANFIVNKNNASAADILALMDTIQETVRKKFNITLEPEVKIIGD
jgi:UDP-N-acetylmuramate dehydrogenase